MTTTNRPRGIPGLLLLGFSLVLLLIAVVRWFALR